MAAKADAKLASVGGVTRKLGWFVFETWVGIHLCATRPLLLVGKTLYLTTRPLQHAYRSPDSENPP